MDFRYETSADASMQLNHTVMMTEDGPAFLSQYDDWNFRVILLMKGYGSEEVKDIRKAGLTFEPLILGYVNESHEICYLGRRPRRMWKQGLCFDNIKALSGYLDDDLLISPPLAMCLMNDYPTMQQAFKACTINGDGRAFHRDLAFIPSSDGTVEIGYKGDTIGSVGKELDFLISDKYMYLKEVLEGIINENR